MNYLLYRRIRGPIFLLTFGVTALLNEWHILRFGKSWPLYLIVYGVMRLVEGTVFAAAASRMVPGFAPAGFAPQGYAPQGYGAAGYQPVAPMNPVPPVPGTGLATIAPAHIQTAASTEEES